MIMLMSMMSEMIIITTIIKMEARASLGRPDDDDDVCVKFKVEQTTAITSHKLTNLN